MAPALRPAGVIGRMAALYRSAMSAFSIQLRRGGIALAAIAVGGFVADFVLNVGLTRLLAPHEYGDYKVAHAFAAFFGVVVLLGGDRAAPKALAGPLAAGETGRVWEYLRFYLQVGLALSVGVIAAVWVTSVLHLGRLDPADHHPVAWMSVAVPLHAIGALASRGLQSARFSMLASVPWRVVAPMLFLAGIAAATTWGQGSVGLPEVVGLAVGTVAVVGSWQWWMLRRLKLPRLERSPDSRVPRVWLATSVPMMGVFLVTLALNQSDLYFLELLGQESEVGLYSAAATCAHFLVLIQTTIVGMILPMLQPALDAGPAEATATRRQGERLLLVVLVPTAVLLAGAARPILSLFGPGYPQAGSVLVFLALGNLAWAVAALSTVWLQFTDRGTVVVFVTLATLGLDSLFNLLLIPRYGMAGAAASTAVTMTLAASAVVLARRREPAGPGA